MSAEPCDLSAVAARAAIAAGTFSAEALAHSCLDRIAAREPAVKAWAALDPDLWLAAARASDAAGNPGRLGGLPFGVKDLADTRDWPTTCGSPIYAGVHANADAAPVALTRRAGGVIAGKTVTTEFACFEPGPTRNPHDPARTPGGSSSGSAAAVACGMVPFAMGTQTAGSIVRPAAYCGVAGYKPTYGTVSASGVKDCARSLDTVGAIARTVADCALWVSAVSGVDLRFSGDLPRRIGVCRSPAWPDASAAMRAAFETVLPGRLRDAGFEAVEIEMPARFAEGLAAQVTIMTWEAAHSLAWEAAAHPDLLSPRLADLLAEGRAMPWERAAAAYALREEVVAAFPEVLARQGVSVLIAPSAAGIAPPAGEGTGSPIFNRLWTLLRGPCVQIPGLADPETGMPLGVQAVAPAGADALALAVAERLQPFLG